MRAIAVGILLAAGCGADPGTEYDNPAPSEPAAGQEQPEPEAPPQAAVIDQDGDGLTVAEEVQFGTSDLLTDSHFDGLTDYVELYVYATDPTDRDTDGDGFEDVAELSAGTNPLDPTDPHIVRITEAMHWACPGFSYERIEDTLAVYEAARDFGVSKFQQMMYDRSSCILRCQIPALYGEPPCTRAQCEHCARVLIDAVWP